MDTSQAGRLGGKAAWKGLTEEQRAAKTRKAARARWKQYYIDHPEKLAERRGRETAKRKREKQQKRKAA